MSSARQPVRAMFLEAARGLHVDRDHAFRSWSLVDSFYDEPWRAYHGFKHISDGIGLLREWGRDTHNMQPIRKVWLLYFCWIMHDAIYNTGSKMNERNSTLLARMIVGTDEPEAYIMPTVHSGERPEEPLAAVLCDVDLSGFGAPWETYQQQGEKIRFEYNVKDDEVWRAGRRRAIEKFHERAVAGTLYFTEYFSERFAAQARENLERDMAELAG